MRKMTVVIPTMQKNRALLYGLLQTLDFDESVDEVILIDNSTFGLSRSFSKVRLISPDGNIFVNPAWNLGVESAKNELVAIFNDDISIPKDFCSRVSALMKPEMGMVGMDCSYITVSDTPPDVIESEELHLNKVDYRDMHFAIAFFLYKSSYFKIPDEIKVFYGDDWIFEKNKQAGRQNYCISGQHIYHDKSLTTGSFAPKNPIFKNDKIVYKKLTLNPLQFIFDIQRIFNGFRLRIFNIEFTYHFKKRG